MSKLSRRPKGQDMLNIMLPSPFRRIPSKVQCSSALSASTSVILHVDLKKLRRRCARYFPVLRLA